MWMVAFNTNPAVLADKFQQRVDNPLKEVHNELSVVAGQDFWQSVDPWQHQWSPAQCHWLQVNHSTPTHCRRLMSHQHNIQSASDYGLRRSCIWCDTPSSSGQVPISLSLDLRCTCIVHRSVRRWTWAVLCSIPTTIHKVIITKCLGFALDLDAAYSDWLTCTVQWKWNDIKWNDIQKPVRGPWSQRWGSWLASSGSLRHSSDTASCCRPTLCSCSQSTLHRSGRQRSPTCGLACPSLQTHGMCLPSLHPTTVILHTVHTHIHSQF